jgi:hypothetical protein
MSDKMGGNSMEASAKRTNSEMGKMGYAPPVKPKGASSIRPAARKPKMRSFSRSK